MIEIEVFQYETKNNIHAVKIWVKNKLAFAEELLTTEELHKLRDALHNEIRWINRYLEKMK